MSDFETAGKIKVTDRVKLAAIKAVKLAFPRPAEYDLYEAYTQAFEANYREPKLADFQWAHQSQPSLAAGAHAAAVEVYRRARAEYVKALNEVVMPAEQAREASKATDRRIRQARQLENTGTCPVCDRNIKLDRAGAMVHHGYERPGHGWIEGDCYGVGYQPLEVSPLGATSYLHKVLWPRLGSIETSLMRLESGVVKSLEMTGYDVLTFVPIAKGTTVIVTAELDARRFEKLLKIRIESLRSEARLLRSLVEGFEKKVSSWKARPLPGRQAA